MSFKHLLKQYHNNVVLYVGFVVNSNLYTSQCRDWTWYLATQVVLNSCSRIQTALESIIVKFEFKNC